MRKLIAISAVSTPISDGKASIENLYGLADDGTVWRYTTSRGSIGMVIQPVWTQLPSLPANDDSKADAGPLT